MKYLAIDTSGKSLTIILNSGEKIYSVHDDNCSFRHSVELMPRVEELAEKSGMDFNDLDFFAAVVGAGSFTGIRIGVATIKALCYCYKKPCVNITSFDTIAYNEKGGKVLSLIDAKHGGFYVCGYDDLKVVIEPAYLMKEQVEELIKEFIPLSFEEVSGLDVKVVSSLEGLKNAIDNKCHLKSYDYDKIEPLYVRKSQAEEGR